MSTIFEHLNLFFHKIFNYFCPWTEELLSCCGRDKECEQLVGGREVNTGERRREDGGHISGHWQPLAGTQGHISGHWQPLAGTQGGQENTICARLDLPSWQTLSTADVYFYSQEVINQIKQSFKISGSSSSHGSFLSLS